MNGKSDNATTIMTQLLEKMIDSQTSNTQALTSLRDEMSGLQDKVIENNWLLTEINKHFTNGFRSDIKEHAESLFELCKVEAEKDRTKVTSIGAQVTALAENLDKHYNAITKPGFWIKAFFGFVASVAILAAAVMSVVSLMDKNASDEKNALQEIKTWIQSHETPQTKLPIFPDSQPGTGG